MLGRLAACARALLVCLLASSCSHRALISAPSASPLPNQKIDIPPLKEVVGEAAHVYFVLIHGVNDHCPDYGLGEGKWLDNDLVRNFGLVREGTATERTQIFDDEFMPGKAHDPESIVTFQRAQFVYQPTRSAVTVIEITWSQLTQWKKTQQLGYDQTTDQTADVPCRYQIPEGGSFPRNEPPPNRVWLNRRIKEATFNRSLVDAILYVGSYGKVIQRGVAEALCRSIGGAPHLDGTGKPDRNICEWPREATYENARFVFVTHSLGSRVLYDTLLNLSGDRVAPAHQVFRSDGPASEVSRSRPVVCRIVSRTAAIYMMANQLSLLGLAYDDGTHTSAQGPQPYDARDRTLPVRGCGVRDSEDLPPATPSPDIPIVAVFSKIWERAKLERADPAGPTRLNIVAFSDTNDLLSWGIPSWYVAAPPSDERLSVDVTNVHVSNATRWFGIFEDPAAAHGNYFYNHDVWQLVFCGATASQINRC